MASIADITNRSVAILGFGQEGQAIAEYLLNHGITPTIYDGKALGEWPASSLAKLSSLKLTAQTGPDYLTLALGQAQVIFRSPGVKISDSAIQTAKQKNLIITSQTEWFFEHCPAKIIGITGTKGKGTTASLLYDMLLTNFADPANHPNRQIFLTGNIGKIQPLEFLDQLTKNDLVVYELSSFQLQNLDRSPQLGICLMVTSDHLDYHKDLDEYYSAKTAICAFQKPEDLLIYNADYQATKKIAAQGQGQKWTVSKSKLSLATAQILESQEIINITNPATQVEQGISLITRNRLLTGKHNLENIAAASLAAIALEVSPEIIQNTINSFSGLPHRLQLVAEQKGVKYYDDSVSTNPDTTIAAINSFTEPTILIVGGALKNLDYTTLVDQILQQPSIKAVVTMGPVGEIIHNHLLARNFSKPFTGPFTEFEKVMNSAKTIAQAGDIILLSPGATSFDMFHNYAERGDEFIKLIST